MMPMSVGVAYWPSTGHPNASPSGGNHEVERARRGLTGDGDEVQPDQVGVDRAEEREVEQGAGGATRFGTISPVEF
jgi:hypothetical protein